MHVKQGLVSSQRPRAETHLRDNPWLDKGISWLTWALECWEHMFLLSMRSWNPLALFHSWSLGPKHGISWKSDFINKERLPRSALCSVNSAQSKEKWDLSLQKIQEIKGKYKPRLGMLKEQQGSTLSKKEKIKRRWKQHTEDLYRWGKRVTDSSEEESYDEISAVLEREVKASLKSLVVVRINHQG